MHPVPTREQDEMLAMVKGVLAREVTPERMLEWEKRPGQAVAELGPRVAELGWLGYGAPEEAGGAGADFVDVALLYQACGFGLLPLQLINAMRGVQAIVDLDPACTLLPDLVSGRKTVALALDEEFVREPARYEARVDGDQVFGKKAYVLNAQLADYFRVAAQESGGLSLVLVEGAGLQKTALKGFADDSQAHVNLEGAPVLARFIRERLVRRNEIQLVHARDVPVGVSRLLRRPLLGPAPPSTVTCSMRRPPSSVSRPARRLSSLSCRSK